MIECKNIFKSYFSGDVETKVLKDISFSIHDGEFLAIMGPSGSGKSTLMHILGALDIATSGSFLLDGQDISKLNDDQLARIRAEKIGFVFQSFNLLPRTTVIRNVILPLVYSGVYGEQRERAAKKALESASLEEERWNHLSNELSGGQMQRVAIARALVNNPSVILADEPTGNLDSKTGRMIIDYFKELNKKEKKTIILITHEQEIAGYADKIIHIKDGQIYSISPSAKSLNIDNENNKDNKDNKKTA